MAKFLNRFESTDALTRIILDAERQLILISPYIKLNFDLKNALNTHLNKPELEMIIVYGKNEEDNRKSISEEDFKYFQSFSNVSIRYHKRLHAKMYANDEQCLITSMNLHNYSLKENIETGILTEYKIVNSLLSLVAPKVFSDPLDSQAIHFADYIIEKSTPQFERKGKKESSFFGLFNSYSEGEVTVNKSRTGYCIRTKQQIPLNVNHPYSREAYESWSSHGSNKTYLEKFCHQCGGKNASSFAKPVCIDCYRLNKRR
ncbi:MAG TPA: phospholipase D family protein [Ginsengibacter sp.]